MESDGVSWIYHPMPLDPTMTWNKAKAMPLLTCIKTRFLCKRFYESGKWQGSKVLSKSGPSNQLTMINLQRFDGEKFSIQASSGSALYVGFLETGLQLMYITGLFIREKRVMCRYNRVVRTEIALEESPQEKAWTSEKQTTDGQTVRFEHMGKQGLRNFKERLKERCDGITQQNVFHWGNNVFETDVENIVSIVGWIPFNIDSAHDKAVFTTLLPKIQRFIPGIKSLNEIDCVFVGDPFNEVDLPLVGHSKRKR